MTQPEAAAEHVPIAAAIIVFGGRVLMVRRRAAEGELSWQFPAGEVKPGESPEDAAVRETIEETGLTVGARGRLGERLHPETGRAMVYVACDVVDGPAYVGDAGELVEVAWCDRATLAGYVRAPFFGAVQEYFAATLT
jgi:8-oxo-dGTP diphosphatase